MFKSSFLAQIKKLVYIDKAKFIYLVGSKIILSSKKPRALNIQESFTHEGMMYVILDKLVHNDGVTYFYCASKDSGCYTRNYLQYISQFMKLTCAGRLLQENLFPNPKEITESMGAIEAIRKHGYDPKDNVTCIVIGDGHKPRTGAMIAFRSMYEVIVVDPACDWNKSFDRLTVIKDYIENVKLPSVDKALIVCVHSHADPVKSWNCIEAKEKIMIAIPCCIPYKVKGMPDLYDSYIDPMIISPHNEILVWKK